jgi:hypothetical protein
MHKEFLIVFKIDGLDYRPPKLKLYLHVKL